jgi:hypothetical protein
MRLLLWILIPLLLLGCSEGFFKDNNDVRPTAAESTEEYRIPTITIRRLESEKIEERPTAIKGEKITWRLDADPAPLKDVVVHVSIPSANNQSVDYWVLIPKFKPYSEEFTNTIYGGAIEVVALPMLSIVGKGLVVNVEKLREGLPTDTYGGHRIPTDFDFPLYHVGNPSQILCDDCSAPVSPLQPTLPANPLPPPSNPLSPPPATDVQVSPVPGTTILPNPRFVLTFNQEVVAATVNGFPATGSGLNWRVFPALTGGSVFLNVEWTNQDGSTGSKVVGPYTVREPDITPPRIVGGTVANGEIKVNPGSINAGGFRYDFDEPVTGSIKLLDGSGIALNWIASVAGQTATLTRVAEQALLLGSTYFIEIDVRDTAGNPSQIRIIFFTDIKGEDPRFIRR